MQEPRVLIVEDESLIAITLEEVLAEAGFAVTTVHDGAAAIAVLEKDHQTFQAVVTDIRMPGKVSGWDVGHRARQLQPEMAMVYCSGDKAVDWSAEGVPGSIMLRKPFAMSQLVTAVSQLITGKNGGPSGF